MVEKIINIIIIVIFLMACKEDKPIVKEMKTSYDCLSDSVDNREITPLLKEITPDYFIE